MRILLVLICFSGFFKQFVYYRFLSAHGLFLSVLKCIGTVNTISDALVAITLEKLIYRATHALVTAQNTHNALVYNTG